MLSKYEKSDPIGLGHSSTVFRGRHRDLGRAVAIKELQQDILQNAKRRDRFFKEADFWADLSHDHIVTVHDVDRHRGWVIMPLMPSSTAFKSASGPLDADTVCKLLTECTRALGYIHARGYLHGNIKPSNLLRDELGRVKLSDGRGIRLDAGDELPAPAGTHKYLAPEFIDDSLGSLGPGVDLYALGFVALELLVGASFNTLFKGVGSEGTDAELAWLRWHSSPAEQAPPTHDVAQHVPHELALIIDRLLLKDPVERYHRAEEVLEALHRAQSPRQMPLAAPGGQPWSASPTAPSTVGQPSAPLPPETADSAAPVPISAAGTALAPRPETPLILRVVSGPRTGEMVGLEGDEFRVGDSENCRLRFDADDYPTVAGRELLFRREAQGWVVRSLGKSGLILNQQLVDELAAIRSGDIVRMSLTGPDFQFIVQGQNAPTLQSIAAQMSGRRQTKSKPAVPRRTLPSSLKAPAAAPAPPAVNNRTTSHCDAAPQVTNETPQPKLPKTAAAAPSNGGPSSPTRWSKRSKNFVVGAGSAVIAALAVIAVPVGGKSDAVGQAAASSTSIQSDHTVEGSNANVANEVIK